MKRLFLLLLCVITLVPSMNACTFDKPSDGTVDSSESLETGAFSVASLADYTVVYSKNEDSGRVHKGIRNLCAALSDKFGVEVEHRNDRVVEDAATGDETCEILVGQTNREASKTVYADLKKVNDYEIRIIDQKVVIAAWDEEIMVRLLQELCDTVNDFSEDRSHFFDSSMQQVGKGTYELENICVGSDGINDYTVVYENTDMGKYLAERITQKVMEKTGYILKTASDPDMVQGKMILVGNTSKGKPADMDLESNEGYYAGSQGDDLYLFV